MIIQSFARKLMKLLLTLCRSTMLLQNCGEAYISEEVPRLLKANVAGCKKQGQPSDQGATLGSRDGACDRNNTRASQSLCALGATVCPKRAKRAAALRLYL